MLFAIYLLVAAQCIISSLFGEPTLSENVATLPPQLEKLIEAQHSLPRYAEAGYFPLGRSPVVDALLGDPFYMPQYANHVSEAIKKASDETDLFDLETIVLNAGGIPLYSGREAIYLAASVDLPQKFILNFGETTGRLIHSYWLTFMQVSQQVDLILGVLSENEKQWIRDHYDAFFFGDQKKGDDYDFFTTESRMPLRFFELASRVDLVKLGECARKLCLIVQDLYKHAPEFISILLKEDFIWKENGLTLIISGKDYATLTEEVDFYIDLGGHNIYQNNAGGTGGVRSAALHIDLLGNNQYIGENFVQGSGFLGVGLLASFSGNNTYIAKAYSQGSGLFGVGLLMNLGGNNRFELNFGGQSFALFGSSLLWNKGGHNTYTAHQGMAQGASSTLGVAFLVDSQGHSHFISGISGKGGTLYGGIGQGGSTGVRNYPWYGNPSFYGGVSFLYSGGDDNEFKIPWLGQGSAYFLSAGILVGEGSHDHFYADYDSQGQGLHLAAGLLLQRGGYNHYEGGWGSLGVGGDRSVGMFIGGGGNNFYQGGDQSVGTARKPDALGVFIETQGNNTYIFKKESNANVQKPRSPNEWPTALFLELGGNNVYSQKVDEMVRGNGLKWGVGTHSTGIDTGVDKAKSLEQVFEKLPKIPRVPFPFDPINGWRSNTAYLPLKPVLDKGRAQDLIKQIATVDYDHRRQLYESLDLFRFMHPDIILDYSSLLENPAKVPDDQFNYAVLWSIKDKKNLDLKEIIEGLKLGTFSSDYKRKMALRLLSNHSPEEIDSLLAKTMRNDSSEGNRFVAAFLLAKHFTPSTITSLKEGLKNDSELVRYAIASGLRNAENPLALTLVRPLFTDSSFYVRRAAALTAISLKDKEGIPVLLDTLKFETLDTTENYGDNLYHDLSQYVCVDFGLDKEAWIRWWNEVKENYAFPDKQAASCKTKNPN